MTVPEWVPWILTAAVLGFLEWRRRKRMPPPASAQEEARPEFSTEPELPIAFGYKSRWLAVRSDDPRAVVAALGLRDDRVANWSSGLEASTRGWVFVTPVVDGWVLVVGDEWSQVEAADSSERGGKTIARIVTTFPDVQLYSTHRVTEYHAWARYRNGARVRAFVYLGESGEVLMNDGSLTPEERAMGVPGDPAECGWVPDEEAVLELASRWSVDPRSLEKRGLPPSAGIVGRA